MLHEIFIWRFKKILWCEITNILREFFMVWFIAVWKIEIGRKERSRRKKCDYHMKDNLLRSMSYIRRGSNFLCGGGELFRRKNVVGFNSVQLVATQIFIIKQKRSNRNNHINTNILSSKPKKGKTNKSFQYIFSCTMLQYNMYISNDIHESSIDLLWIRIQPYKLTYYH